MPQGPKVPQDHRAKLVQLVLLDHKDHKDPTVPLAHRDHRDHKDPQEPLVQETLVPQDPTVPLDHKDPQEPLVQVVQCSTSVVPTT